LGVRVPPSAQSIIKILLVREDDIDLVVFYFRRVGTLNEASENFEAESLRYLRASITGSQNFPPDFLSEISELIKPKTILDVGCGNGANLVHLGKIFGAKCTGLEPSTSSISILRELYRQNQNIEFVLGNASRLPFDAGQFDLVVAWSVLHWVPREYFLQAIGELIRVTNKNLLIMEFVAAKEYRTPYKHKKGLFTYKVDFEKVVLASGIVQSILERRWVHNIGEPEHPFRSLAKVDLEPFLGNNFNYVARKAVVFEKRNDILPLYEEEHFNAPSV
jgi:ubiquinone/menaquinone biosynthesis C-methylase UbiE